MALSGTINGSCTQNTDRFSFFITWSATQNTNNNTSTITVKSWWKTTNTGNTFNTVSARSYGITINGSTSSSSKVFDVTSWNSDKTYLIQTATKTVTHNSDGTLTISISAYANGTAGEYGPSSSTATSGNCTASGNVTLNKITPPSTTAGATTLDSIECSTTKFNGKFTLKYTPKSSTYYNLCNIRLYWMQDDDSNSQLIRSYKLGKSATSQQTNTFTLSSDELNTIYDLLDGKNMNSGILRFTLRTYSDSGYATQVGSSDVEELTLSIPTTITLPDISLPSINIFAGKPIVTINASPNNPSTVPSALSDTYIQGISKVNIEISAIPKGGASISSYGAVFDGEEYIGKDIVTSAISRSGDLKITAVAIDSNGYQGTKEKTITVQEYSPPLVKSVTCYRCDDNGNKSDSGATIKIVAMRSFSSVGGNNKCKLQYRYRDSAQNNWSSWSTLIDENESQNFKYDNTIDLGLQSKNAYLFEIQAIDSFGETDSMIIGVSGESIPLHLAEGGKKVGIGRYAGDVDEKVYVGWDTLFDKDIDVTGNVNVTEGELTAETTTLGALTAEAANLGATTATTFSTSGKATLDSLETSGETYLKGSIYVKLGSTKTALDKYIESFIPDSSQSTDCPYPVGGICVTATNTNPNGIYSGTAWALIDKEFEEKYDSELSRSVLNTEYTITSYKANSDTVIAFYRKGHSVYFCISIQSDSTLNDTSVNLLKINYNKLGFSSLAHNQDQVIGASDGGNGILSVSLNKSTGLLSTNDYIMQSGTGGIPAGSTIVFNIHADVLMSAMDDDACNKFYWKRTS